MRNICPRKCGGATQRPLEKSEISQLSADARASLVLLRQQGLVCDNCGAVYVSCLTGTIYLEKLATVEQPMLPFVNRPSAPPKRSVR
jgi:hypothetical protein